MYGRPHYYEGYTNEQLAVPVQALYAAGVKRLLLTSTVGSLTKGIPVGSLVLVCDHLNWSGMSPLRGPNQADLGERFFSLESAYDLKLRKELAQAAARAKLKLPEGVMVWYPGPNFETPTEIRAFRTLGADVVGMSTVPEVIVAAHCGLAATSIAAVTNLAAGLDDKQHTHADTLAQAANIVTNLRKLIVEFLA